MVEKRPKGEEGKKRKYGTDVSAYQEPRAEEKAKSKGRDGRLSDRGPRCARPMQENTTASGIPQAGPEGM